MANTREEAVLLLKAKIEGHILSIREDIKNAGFDTSYMKMYLFEEEFYGKHEKEIYATLHNGAQVKREDRIDFFFHIKGDIEQ